MSFQAELDNRTPFAVDRFVLPDPDGQEVVLVVLAASFQAVDGEKLEVAGEQPPVRTADVPWGQPARSSTRYEADLALIKPRVDVLVVGHAYAPRQSPAPKVCVELSVGDIKKSLVVHGDRTSTRHGPSRPQPFLRLPIVYERAYGGTLPNGEVDPRNPVGVGHRGAASADPAVLTQVPNVEYLNAPRGAQLPAGFGAIGRGWQPRIGFAGTYDSTWIERRWPLMPQDFDSRYYQSAPLDQQSETLQGGEEGHVVNMTQDGLWCFRLPRLDVPLHLLHDDRQARASLRMDTLVIEPDERRLTLVSRAAIRTQRDRAPLRAVVLGHVKPAWLRARAARKPFLDGADGSGTDFSRPVFS